MGLDAETKAQRIITKWELLENSIVSIPANPLALIQAISAKSIVLSDKTIKELDLDKVITAVTKEIPTEADKVLVPVIDGKPGQDAPVVDIPPCQPGCECPKCKYAGYLSLGDLFMDTEHDTGEEENIGSFPNEHAARQQDPGKYKKFRRKNNAFGSGIHVIYGITGSGKAEVQSIRFDASKFTVAEAKKWLADHNYKTSIEPAAGKEAIDDEEESSSEDKDGGGAGGADQFLSINRYVKIIRNGPPDIEMEKALRWAKSKGKIV